MSEKDCCNETMRDMEMISNLVKEAELNGLLTEVIYTISQQDAGTTREKCFAAMCEWDL